MKKVIFLALLLLTLPGIAVASFSSAMDAYERQDFRTAAAEFDVLANQGDADAQYMLGYMHALGEGTLQDYVEAHKWFNLAASQGNKDAREARDAVAKRMTSRQIARAQQMAREWKPTTVDSEPVRSEPQSSDEERYVASRETVIQVQSRLNELGYDAGPADGAPGRRTRSAIRAYQADNDLFQDGEISQALVESLGAAAPAVREGDLAYPDVWNASTEEMDDEAKALLDELKQLLDKAQEKRAADRWLIEDLNQLIASGSRPVASEVIYDNFSDQDYQWNPSWRLNTGRSELRRGQGLVLISEQRRRTSSNDLGRSIIGALLGGGSSSNQASGQAEITINETIPDGFAVLTRFGSVAPETGLSLSLKQGNNSYLLKLLPGRRGGLELWVTQGSQQRLLDAYDRELRFDDGQSHTIEWLRDAGGAMNIALDGQTVIRTSNQSLSGDFASFSAAITGGKTTLQEVKVLGISNN